MAVNKLATFAGGVHVRESKELTEKKPIKVLPAPKRVVIPLHQHTGAPCEPLVKVGEEVRLGQKIGDSGAALTAPVHASVSGKVTEIAPYLQIGGKETLSVVIESDGKDEPAEGVGKKRDLADLTPDEIRGILREAGIVGLGGAAFPTYFKLSPPPGKKFDTVILNGAECEPYLTADHRLMVEQPDEIVSGLLILMKAAGVKRGFIGIERNKPDAIAALSDAIKRHHIGDAQVNIVPLKVKYPQGAEKQLIRAITGREVPSGGLPVDVGCVVNNVGTAFAVAGAVLGGMPLVSRVVTVTGSCIREPQNVRTRIGTPLRDVIEACGGFVREPRKLIVGGPMMGVAVFSADVPILKGSSGILALSPEEAEVGPELPCVRCGKCVGVCPMRLLPLFIANYAEAGRFEEAERYNVLDCIECGACTYICPSRRPLVQYARLAKAEILARRKKK